MKMFFIVIMMSFIGVIFAQNTENVEMQQEVTKIDKKTYKVEKLYEDGSVAEIGFYYKGKKNGEWKAFNKDGTLQAIANYDNGKKDGEWIIYNTDASIKYFVYYDNDKKISAFDLDKLAQNGH